MSRQSPPPPPPPPPPPNLPLPPPPGSPDEQELLLICQKVVTVVEHKRNLEIPQALKLVVAFPRNSRYAVINLFDAVHRVVHQLELSERLDGRAFALRESWRDLIVARNILPGSTLSFFRSQYQNRFRLTVDHPADPDSDEDDDSDPDEDDVNPDQDQAEEDPNPDPENPTLEPDSVAEDSGTVSTPVTGENTDNKYAANKAEKGKDVEAAGPQDSGEVVKAGGNKWKAKSEEENAPFVEKAEKLKEEYEPKMADYKKLAAGCAEKSCKSTEVNDEDSADEGDDE